MPPIQRIKPQPKKELTQITFSGENSINSRTSIVIGVDPGIGGGLAAILPNEIITTKMPSTDKDIWLWLVQFKHKSDTVAVLEQISPGFPGTAKSSMAKLYGSYRSLRMALTGVGIRIEEVQSKKWQKEMGIIKRPVESDTQWKNRLKMKAQQLQPHHTITLHTADAILMAEYGIKILNRGITK